MQAGDDCDRLAANPTDSKKVTEGVTFEMLKLQADDAINACTRAVAQFPSELRYYQYQLGRAMQFRDRKKAFEIVVGLTKGQRYPAAFDNAGWMYYQDKKDPAAAVLQFKMGAQLGDGDSMVSLAEMIDRNLFSPPNPYDMKLALWRKAAELGHAGGGAGAGARNGQDLAKAGRAAFPAASPATHAADDRRHRRRDRASVTSQTTRRRTHHFAAHDDAMSCN